MIRGSIRAIRKIKGAYDQQKPYRGAQPAGKRRKKTMVTQYEDLSREGPSSQKKGMSQKRVNHVEGPATLCKVVGGKRNVIRREKNLLRD